MPLKVFIVSSNTSPEVAEVKKLLASRGMLEVRDPALADVVLALGDDRTFLDAVRLMGESETPILGVSARGTGYLTSTSIDELEATLEAFERNEHVQEEYTKLKGVVDGKAVLYALNEIAIFPSRTATLMSYELHVDGEFIWSDRADGVLVATPIGSTAYALSAGGPVILEEAQVLEVVPVNSVDISKRPLVVPDSAMVELRNLSSRFPLEAIADGGERVKVRESVVVEKAEAPIRIIKLKSKALVREALMDKVVGAYEMPPSARFILKMLQLRGPMSARELTEETGLPERTVRHALAELLRRNLVRRVINSRDARQVYYEVVG